MYIFVGDEREDRNLLLIFYLPNCILQILVQIPKQEIQLLSKAINLIPTVQCRVHSARCGAVVGTQRDSCSDAVSVSGAAALTALRVSEH